MDKEGRSIIKELFEHLRMDLKDEQVDILITLSDNKGYSSPELESIIKKRPDKYIKKLLQELSSETFGDFVDSCTIQDFHLKDPLSLVHKLEDQKDAVSKYLFKNIDMFWKKSFSDPNQGANTVLLAAGLNELLRDVNLYNKERFRGVELSEHAEDLIKRKEELQGGHIRILNRILIADAYPNEIYKTKISLIHKSGRKPRSLGYPYLINLDLRAFEIIVEHLIRDIKLDRIELELLKTKYATYMRNFSEFEKLYSDLGCKKLIKNGKYDISFYENRYEKRIGLLWKFMTSNYVKELTKKYDSEKIKIHIYGLPSNEFDLIKFLSILREGQSAAEESDEEIERGQNNC